MKIIIKGIKYYFYKQFGNILFKIETKRRIKINKINRQEKYQPIEKFREFEVLLRDIKYPNNDFNKIMSMMLGDIEQFEFIVKRYRKSWRSLKIITCQDNIYLSLNPKTKSHPCHPLEEDTQKAINVDVKSLFIFGSVLVNRLLILLSMYFPQQSGNPSRNDFKKVYNLYKWLENTSELSDLAKVFKENFLQKIKWLHSVMRFYRNYFIEHVKRGYQQGSHYDVLYDEFSLSHIKWDYGDVDNKKVEKFREEMEKRNIIISGRTGHIDSVNRYYVQRLFDNINLVPYDIMEEASAIIENVGVQSPQPEKLILELETFLTDLFDFMINEINNSDLIKYKNL